ncbi:peptidoglycan editing factor PgeF [Cupriavidus gilardii]|uniref:peptidoglycan editing factor PgeF n=1 Tax=Cupriavidus gilardii TaxID=82541 RepID=UPI001ABE8F46|nr:peptidoglycan editing factor PgeF [Cupriavidus gilardii]MBO4120880.1 peptidoglycan editing factor PgeF [Cupriavidus gilardii]
MTNDDAGRLSPLIPDWPAPAQVRALSTTRSGGVSRGPYGLADGSAGGLNLGTHVGDDADAVAQNRRRLRAWLPSAPRWLDQVHGCAVVTAEGGEGADDGDEVDGSANDAPPRADASISTAPGQVCAVMTADCLPVLLCDRAGTVVGAAHAGWRGLCEGVIEATLDRMAKQRADAGSSPQWLAWLGPAIGPDAFEVGAEVRSAFIERALPHEREAVEQAFRSAAAGKYLADLYALARIRLARAGCVDVYGGDACTVSDPQRFYSYRRDGVTGRMASLVWLAPMSVAR